ncbi:MAG: hypothetical protein M3P27_00710 [Acidobacteriota bacterium]|nr:hypothetical protein [Acidobacteriota bacterium]
MQTSNVSDKRDTVLIVLAAAFTSLCAFLYYFTRGQILLYGDSVAHINIARRVFDSAVPSLLHFGTVWLPLPHLLILPFIIPLDWWQSGIGGSIYSMGAYIFGCLGSFRLALRLTHSRAAAAVACIVFAANPNLLYMQSTAMTEPLCIALFIWIAVYFTEFEQASRPNHDEGNAQTGDARAARALTRCGCCIAAMALTRYDGWFAGLVFVLVAFVVLIRRHGWGFLTRARTPLWRGARNLALISAAAPAFWFAWNWLLSGDPLDFALGPYSAKAIAVRTAMPNATYPGQHSLAVAATFFRKCAELNLGEAPWHHAVFFAAIFGTLLAVILNRRAWPALLLWLPWPFYTLSLAYGDVPIFMPMWWPYSYYNDRFGLQLLPAIALGVGLAVAATTNVWVMLRPEGVPAHSPDSPGRGEASLVRTSLARTSLSRTSWVRSGIVIVILLITGATYYTAWRATPITLREARAISKARIALETRVAEELLRLPPDSRILIYMAEHGGVLQRAGIPLRRTINESTHAHRELPHGLWERALADPRQYADYVVAFEGDPVARSAAAHRADLRTIIVIHSAGQAPATIYRVEPAPQAPASR